MHNKIIIIMNISSEIILRCPELEDPPYGSVNQTGNKPGSTAHYDCDYGFKLVGDEYRECLYTGYWNGSEPICKSIYIMIHIVRVYGYTNMSVYHLIFVSRNYYQMPSPQGPPIWQCRPDW